MSYLFYIIVFVVLLLNVAFVAVMINSKNKQLKTIEVEQKNLDEQIRQLESDTLSYVWLKHRAKVNKMKQSINTETKSVVMVEGRQHHLLKMCLENLHSRLPNWKLHLVHGIENEDFVKSLVNSFDFPVQLSKLNKPNFNITEFSNMIGSVNFWLNICDTDRVLLSQTDAFICHDSKYQIEEFFCYDYVGAPWYRAETSEPSKKETVVVGNCGLCLCKRQTMLDTVSKYPYSDFVRETRTNEVDVYFGRYIQNVPPALIAKSFSVEKVWYDRPFGVHKPFDLKDPSKLRKLEPHCEGIMNLLEY